MRREIRRTDPRASLLGLLLSLTLASCGGGGEGGGAAPPAAMPTPAPTPPSTVTISGRITYARIPHVAPSAAAFGLDYAAERQEPARGIAVEVVNASTGSVIASGLTDADGGYSIASVPAATSVVVRARAELRSPATPALPRWQFTVRDFAADAAPYVYDSPRVSSGTGLVQDVAIPSGWTAATRQPIDPARPAAPFAILDTIHRALHTVLEVAPDTDFPPLTIDWTPSKAARQTFYDDDGGGPNRRISLSAAVGEDIDEYDPHVIAHEFGHYLEDRFSRSDSIGGPHAAGDLLDKRVAFGEGFGYAFAAIALGDPLVRDVVGPAQQQESRFSVDTDFLTNEGWFSEASAQEILWDLFDSGPGDDDGVGQLGFAPLWSVLTGAQRETEAVTSLFTFVTALERQHQGDAALLSRIDGLVAGEATVAEPIDELGTAETHFAAPSLRQADVLPLYTPIEIGGGPRTVRSNAPPAPTTESRIFNKLSNRRFLRLTVPTPGRSVNITVTAAPAGRDVDVRIYRRGALVVEGIEAGNESFTTFLDEGSYVLEVYDCGNADCGPDAPGPVDITVNIT